VRHNLDASIALAGDEHELGHASFGARRASLANQFLQTLLLCGTNSFHRLHAGGMTPKKATQDENHGQLVVEPYILFAVVGK
jgi:hypothetical protein